MHSVAAGTFVWGITGIRRVRRSRVRVAGVAVAVALLGTASEARTSEPPKLLCTPPPGSELLPPTARHGLIDHMRQYPTVHLATPAERARARRILGELLTAAARQSWRSSEAAERLGYDTRTAPRRAGDPSVRFFHAERHQEERRGPLLDPTRPKALIYANAPGRPLVLVGAMWSTRDGERGPTPAGSILRWHSHVVCKRPGQRGLKPPPGGKCPPGARLQQGTSEMLHVWFTRDLRSAFAISAPRPELCAARLIPAHACR